MSKAPKTEAEWRQQPGPWAHLTKEQTDELIAAAVRAEREACAAIADERAEAWPSDERYTDMHRSIAAAIRARK